MRLTVASPKHVQEYQLTAYSLYGAVSTGLSADFIIKALTQLSKVAVPRTIEKIIRTCTSSYGKVKLVLRKNRYFCESKSTEVLQDLLNDPTIKAAQCVCSQRVIAANRNRLLRAIIYQAESLLKRASKMYNMGKTQPLLFFKMKTLVFFLNSLFSPE